MSLCAVVRPLASLRYAAAATSQRSRLRQFLLACTAALTGATIGECRHALLAHVVAHGAFRVYTERHAAYRRVPRWLGGVEPFRIPASRLDFRRIAQMLLTALELSAQISSLTYRERERKLHQVSAWLAWRTWPVDWGQVNASDVYSPKSRSSLAKVIASLSKPSAQSHSRTWFAPPARVPCIACG